jgi:hypothetical protein
VTSDRISSTYCRSSPARAAHVHWVVTINEEVLELVPVPHATRAGDLMRAADALRLALDIAELATLAAEKAGAPGHQVARLREALRHVRATV